MTEAKITKLHAVDPIPNTGSADGEITRLQNFIKEKEILLEWDDTDIDLDSPSSDEKKIGSLNRHEREHYVVGKLVEQVIRDALIDIEADGTDEIARIMREERVAMPEAASRYREKTQKLLAEEDQEFLNQCALTVGHCMTSYEWSVRQRYNIWRGQLIVRRGYVAYTYDG